MDASIRSSGLCTCNRHTRFLSLNTPLSHILCVSDVLPQQDSRIFLPRDHISHSIDHEYRAPPQKIITLIPFTLRYLPFPHASGAWADEGPSLNTWFPASSLYRALMKIPYGVIYGITVEDMSPVLLPSLFNSAITFKLSCPDVRPTAVTSPCSQRTAAVVMRSQLETLWLVIGYGQVLLGYPLPIGDDVLDG